MEDLLEGSYYEEDESPDHESGTRKTDRWERVVADFDLKAKGVQKKKQERSKKGPEDGTWHRKAEWAGRKQMAPGANNGRKETMDFSSKSAGPGLREL